MSDMGEIGKKKKSVAGQLRKAHSSNRGNNAWFRDPIGSFRNAVHKIEKITADNLLHISVCMDCEEALIAGLAELKKCTNLQNVELSLAYTVHGTSGPEVSFLSFDSISQALEAIERHQASNFFNFAPIPVVDILDHVKKENTAKGISFGAVFIATTENWNVEAPEETEDPLPHRAGAKDPRILEFEQAGENAGKGFFYIPMPVTSGNAVTLKFECLERLFTKSGMPSELYMPHRASSNAKTPNKKRVPWWRWLGAATAAAAAAAAAFAFAAARNDHSGSELELPGDRVYYEVAVETLDAAGHTKVTELAETFTRFAEQSSDATLTVAMYPTADGGDVINEEFSVARATAIKNALSNKLTDQWRDKVAFYVCPADHNTDRPYAEIQTQVDTGPSFMDGLLAGSLEDIVDSFDKVIPYPECTEFIDLKNG